MVLNAAISPACFHLGCVVICSGAAIILHPSPNGKELLPGSHWSRAPTLKFRTLSIKKYYPLKQYFPALIKCFLHSEQLADLDTNKARLVTNPTHKMAPKTTFFEKLKEMLRLTNGRRNFSPRTTSQSTSQPSAQTTPPRPTLYPIDLPPHIRIPLSPPQIFHNGPGPPKNAVPGCTPTASFRWTSPTTKPRV
jgi:hypothetical protein